MFAIRKKNERIDHETLLSFKTACTLPQILSRQADRFKKNKIAIREKAYGIWQTYNWHDYFRYTKFVSLGLIALGLKKDENVGLVLNNNPEWLFSTLGVQSIGAITVNLFTSAMAEELVDELKRIQAAYVFVQDQEQFDKLLFSRDSLPHIRGLIYIDPNGMELFSDNPWLISFRQLYELGEELDRDQPDFFNHRLWEGSPKDIALMLTTSWTTDSPKLAMLSHENLIEIISKWLETVPIGIGDRWFSINPTATIVEQLWGVGIALVGGLTINFPETRKTAMYDLREIGPTILMEPAGFWENMATNIKAKIASSGFIKQSLFNFSQKIGKTVLDLEYKKKPVHIHLKILHWFLGLIISQPLLDRIGLLRTHTAFTWSYAISPDIINFFRINGLNLKQCYGLPESGGPFQFHSDKEVKPGTVGKPLPGFKVMIGHDQEILISSKSNFVGYYQDGNSTAKAIVDGWLHTGDRGFFDEDNHLVITGKKADAIQSEEGIILSPEVIEARFKSSPYIKEIVVVGLKNPPLSALINFEFSSVASWAKARKIISYSYIDLCQQPAVEELIKKEIQTVNTHLAKAMQVHKFVLLHKLLDADDEELTRTGKVRRQFISDKYQALISAISSGENEFLFKSYIRICDSKSEPVETTIKILTI